jgi:hypothetical protein
MGTKSGDFAQLGWLGQHGIGSSLFNGITPAFDDFDPPALIKDNDFRIDLPLLMLYLDKHKPRKTTKSFINPIARICNPDSADLQTRWRGYVYATIARICNPCPQRE